MFFLSMYTFNILTMCLCAQHCVTAAQKRTECSEDLIHTNTYPNGGRIPSRDHLKFIFSAYKCILLTKMVEVPGKKRRVEEDRSGDGWITSGTPRQRERELSGKEVQDRVNRRCLIINIDLTYKWELGRMRKKIKKWLLTRKACVTSDAPVEI